MKRIGDYAIVRELGSGAMGIVYEATDSRSGQRVALKVLHAGLTQKEEARKRFFGEMHILAGLQHPNIVRSLANAEIDGRIVMVLEYLEGRTLREELDSGKMALPRAIAIASSVASALIAAHERKPPVVHRDLKPDNLMLLPNGTVKVMDFGVAKVVVGTGDATAMVGTPRYMSPEQAEGNPITPSADLYALGILLYEMLAGQRPFSQAVSMLSVIRAQVDRTPTPFSEELRKALPPELEALVFALLAKAPADRPRDARTVLQALERCARAASPRGSVSRHGRWLLGIAFVAVLGATVATTWIVANREPARAHAKAKAKATATATSSTAPSGPPSAGDASAITRPHEVAKDACAGLTECTPFHPPEPSNVDLDLILRESNAIATRIDRGFKLTVIGIFYAVEKGVIDLTQSRASVVASYQMPHSGVNIETTATRQIVKRFQFGFEGNAFFLGEFCPFRQAWEAAKASGYPFNDATQASLMGQNQGMRWTFDDFKEPDTSLRAGIEIDARTCVVTDFVPPGGRPKPTGKGAR